MTHIDRLIGLAALNAAAIPASARRMAEFSLFDWLVCARAGEMEEASAILRGLVAAERGTAQASVAGLSVRVPARAAALANGTVSHALDYDDTHFAHVGHPSVAIMPAALAAGEQEDAGAAAVVEAFLLGAEASCRLGLAFGRGHYDRGFHQTATAGAFGATIAAGRLYRLTPEQMRMALGLASTRASGLRSQFGTMGKPYNAGIAAANGVEAALLARQDFVSCADGIGGPQGFLATHADARGGGEVWDAPPPQRFVFEEVKYKFHACCHGTHAMIEALAEVRHAHGLAPGQVRRVRVRTNPRWLTVCDIKAPQSGLEAKFSYGLLAAMTLDGLDTASGRTYTDEVCGRPELRDLAGRVEVAGDANLPDTAATVSISLAGGTEIEGAHDLAAPLPHEEIEAKLRTKAFSLLGRDRAERLWGAVGAIDRLKARDLGHLLGG